MIKETADKDLLVFIFKLHILSLNLTYQKSAKIDDVTYTSLNVHSGH